MTKERYAEDLLTEKEKRLMQLLFHGGATQQDIALFTDGMDVDTENCDYMLMLSYLGRSMDWQWFPKEAIPRLQGLHRYYQVRNAMGIKGLLAQIEELQAADIPVMLLKGMAMRHYYAEGIPRIMSDMDLLVPEDKFEQAVHILCAGGREAKPEADWSRHILDGPASIDLHKWFFKHHGEKNENIWERAISIDFYGKKVYVPSPEDMFVHQLDTRARAILDSEAEKRRMRWLFDCRKICTKAAFDWKIVMQRIKQFDAEVTAYFMLPIFAECFPELCGQLQTENLDAPAKKYCVMLKRLKTFKKIKYKVEEAKKEKAVIQYMIWGSVKLCYQYRYLKSKSILIEETPLSLNKYIKKEYNQDTLRGCIKMQVHNAFRRLGAYRKGEDVV